MRQCSQCGGKLKRNHRSWLQRLVYVAMFTCPDCGHDEFVPRLSYRFGSGCRCPRCGTPKVTKLRERDHIDRMQAGLWNLVARLTGGQLYHCCLCRLQFYDRRPFQQTDTRRQPPTLAAGQVKHVKSA
jgi:transcription elongation factor Elf1